MIGLPCHRLTRGLVRALDMAVAVLIFTVFT